MTETTHSTRTPSEVMRAHGKALMAGDLDGVVEMYSSEAVAITPEGVFRGREGVREMQSKVMSDLHGASFSLGIRHAADGVIFLEWSAQGDGYTIKDGVDTIVIRDGFIAAQTIRYTRLDG